MGRVRPAAAALALALALGPGPAAAEIYRYIGDDGGLHFTTDLEQVPSEQREAARSGAAARPPVNRAEAPEPSAAPIPDPLPSNTPCPPGARCTGLPAAPALPSEPAVERYQGRDEASWRDEHDRLRIRVEQLERLIESLEENGADNAPSPWRENVSRRNYERYADRHAAWERAKRDVEVARTALERFEERARRAGVPPGWLR